ncbi:hypothetical protein D477_012940 [Arthrobacter crystallopoietes BAB-32]|uniref:N-acetylglutamate synthase n=1 Tax=Arthrobacter crystallopoietes BAB-32 TaxID=1246476 RepID=N1V185_9MICC|nr:hypothetical protein [Arthrobacter crystallopoietes]EMY33822.1 hypothetical protein D477_012940 [Arthrobacter crystallopoietes BAB-32]
MSESVTPMNDNTQLLADGAGAAPGSEPVSNGTEPDAGIGPDAPATPTPVDPAAAAAIIDGKVFAPVANTASGEVGATTLFRYHQDGKVIWAEYAGGAVVRGYLVGTRSGDRLDFRYSHLNIDLQTASGVCESRISVLDDGRVQFRETWQWESRPEQGTSIVEELPPTGAQP